MSSFCAPLAQAYVMKKKYEEKLEKMDKAEAGRYDDHEKGHAKRSREARSNQESFGSFGFIISRMFEKVHPSSAVPS
ncbi:hypothetical protein OROMI_017900 [Orobanche minor]